MSRAVQEISIDGKHLKVTNLDKVLYPVTGFTKGQVLDYYARIAPVILPHLKGRPLTLKRYPEGVHGPHFYEKQCPRYHPKWLKLKSVARERRPGDIDYCVVDDRAGLLWVANLASLEIHILLSRSTDVSRPTAMVFDLDPGAPADILDSASVALELREMLGNLGLESWPKASGGKGLHLYVPLNTPVTYDETKPFARALAELLEQRNPKRVVSKMSKSLRKGKVFLDWSQNDAHKTTVCVYSLRGRERPTVSTPVTWDEVEGAVRRKAPESLQFESEAVLERVQRRGDLFAPVLKVRQRLPAPLVT